jgi:predicted oxidoreductase
MKTLRIGNVLEVSRIAYGCMEIGGDWSPAPLTEPTKKEAMNSVRAALDEGINFFDHADIYGRGKSEEAFAGIWSKRPGLRDQIIIQSKCGIRFADDPVAGAPGRYDFSRQHILSSVEGSLRRLKTDHLDVLLLHRPDPLVEPEEVAQAFNELDQQGKVRLFGVSNHNAAQINLLKKFVRQQIVVNQVELNVLHSQLIDEGVTFNQADPAEPRRGAGTLEYCRMNNITMQTWGSLARGVLTGKETNSQDERIRRSAQVVDELAREKGTSGEAILVAWLLRHPARFQPIIGTTRPERIRAACQGANIELTREEWYRLFIAGRGALVP